MRHVGTSVFLSLALLLSGCGRLGFSELTPATDEPDAGGTGSDAISPPPLLGTATMTRLSPFGSLDNHPVVFHNADGSVLSLEQTDSSGRVSRDVHENAMITVVGNGAFSLGGGGGGGALFTIMGVQPDDNLSHGTNQDPWDALAHVEASLPGPHASAAFYAIPTGCGSYAKAELMSPSKFEVNRACHGDITSLDLIAYAFDSSEKLVASSVLQDVAFAADGPTQVMFPAWDDSPNNVNISLSNPPAAAEGADLVLSAVNGGVTYATSMGGTELNGMDGQDILPMPASFGTGIEHLVQVYHYVGGAFRDRPQGTTPTPARLGGGGPSTSYAVSLIQRRETGFPTAIQYNVADELPTPIAWVNIDTDVIERPMVSFPDNGSTSLMDGGVALISWGNEPDWSYFQWWILFPPGTTQLQLPELPDALASYRPGSNSVLDVPYVIVFDADYIGGYSDMRNAYGFDMFIDQFAQPRLSDWLIKAATGPGGFPNVGQLNR